MTLSNFKAIAWPRIVAEGAAIVVSILLAFWIDAWWADRGEQKQAEALLRSLYEDFASNQKQVTTYVKGNRRILQDARSVLAQVTAAEIGGQVSVPFDQVLSIVGSPTYSPQDSSLQAALSSGQIELVQNERLRNLLAVWRQQLEDTNEDELLIRDLVVHQLVPSLATQLRLGRAFEYDTMVGHFLGRPGDPAQAPFDLRVTTNVEALVAERVFYGGFVVDGLEDLYASQAEILQLIEQELNGLIDSAVLPISEVSVVMEPKNIFASEPDGNSDLLDFANRYAEAWSGGDPAAFATFYAETGSLRVNEGEPAVGRPAIEAMAGGFMTSFPDMKVELVELRQANGFIEFHWRWTGTYTGPGGNGAAVDLVGYEQWLVDENGLIQESRGHMDDAEYQRQLNAGPGDSKTD